MPDEPQLPPPPRIALAVARDRTAESRASGGFVDVRRLDLVAQYRDGTRSAPFAYDVVTRAALDAAILVAYEDAEAGRRVYVRSATRPPLALRDESQADLWEMPAGLVEPGETPRQAAVRELEEELGFRAPASALVELGPWTFPAPALLAERQYTFCIDVTGVARGEPTEDGSALERGAAIAAVPLSALLAACREGRLRDAKTELALRRLAELRS